MTLTLNFQGQIWNFLYLSQKWPDCQETKSKHINWTLGFKCDHRVWPWPWPWPWIFKVKYGISYISAKRGPIATKRKANISTELQRLGGSLLRSFLVSGILLVQRHTTQNQFSAFGLRYEHYIRCYWQVCSTGSCPVPLLRAALTLFVPTSWDGCIRQNLDSKVVVRVKRWPTRKKSLLILLSWLTLPFWFGSVGLGGLGMSCVPMVR